MKYIGGIAKNRKVKQLKNGKLEEEKRLDEIAESLPKDEFKIVELGEKKLWVALIKVEIAKLSQVKTIAIVIRCNSENKLHRQPLINADSLEKATEIDYLITNESQEKVTAEWVVKKYSPRNLLEVF